MVNKESERCKRFPQPSVKELHSLRFFTSLVNACVGFPFETPQLTHTYLAILLFSLNIMMLHIGKYLLSAFYYQQWIRQKLLW